MALALFKYPELVPPAAPTLDERITFRGRFGSALVEFHARGTDRFQTNGIAWGIRTLYPRLPTEMVARDAELQGDYALARLVRLRAGRMFEDKCMVFTLPGPGFNIVGLRMGNEYRYRDFFERTFGTVRIAARRYVGTGTIRIVGNFNWNLSTRRAVAALQQQQRAIGERDADP